MRTRTELDGFGITGLLLVLSAPVVWMVLGNQIAEALERYPRPGARIPHPWLLTLATFQPVIGLALLILGRTFVTETPGAAKPAANPTDQEWR